ncbi:integrase arm-type DNA-binding domain-containing protein [Bradyrhizobium sp. 24]|uniref:tyrosine-type recombinase/integrase n=1 Tax=unclassified Bradyrhizobium TaxID=2631580 RepID=UPI001FFB5A02|nr:MULTISPECIES: site-specific integrase [unclassified Bradyrhizobium]MCK1302950.1 integrase arm-type DNA-binding domain-containing protein [Bradyrhizobium sp. 37]MCK1380995.1 integrase arm-type DNA-binding domain-containing protein [Bradyrhizobium sp. 24]MCK1772446.1 integrase arm-type DNA-binding domain-containing protein [Bradyrhizobium sp. 134]
MAKTRALSSLAIEQLKPRAVRYEKSDGGAAGLFLVVHPSGLKSWVFRFRSPVACDQAGQRAPKKLTLGPLALTPSPAQPQIGHPLTPSQARMLATAAAEDVRRGIDPTHVRRQEKAEAKREAVRDDTIDAAMVEFLKRYKGRKRQGLRDSTRLLTAHYFGLKPDPENSGDWVKSGNSVLGKWSGRPLASLTKYDAITLLDGLVDSGRGVTANRTLTVLKTFFDWCVDRDLRESSPVVSLDAFAHETERERKLSAPELVAAWKVADREGYPFGRLIQSLILTGQRRDELRELPRSELDLRGTQIVLDDGGRWCEPLWTIPKERTKNGREHLVPLSPQATDLLKSLPTIKGKGLLFTTTGETPISGLSKAKKRFDEAMLAELRNTDPDATIEPWTLHDLRRTFYSGLQALGFSIEVAEACVNHSSGSIRGVAKVYARHKYLREKTQAFTAWARYVDDLVNGRTASNVIAFQREPA